MIRTRPQDPPTDASPQAGPRPVDPDRATDLRLFTILQRAAAVLRERARADVARHGLTPAEFAVLEVLYHRGPLSLGDIQWKILVSSGGITYLVDRLVQRGLVERRPSPEDRRTRFAALTDAGVALLDEIFPEHARALSEGMQALDPEEKRILADLLKRLGRGAAAP